MGLRFVFNITYTKRNPSPSHILGFPMSLGPDRRATPRQVLVEISRDAAIELLIDDEPNPNDGLYYTLYDNVPSYTWFFGVTRVKIYSIPTIRLENRNPEHKLPRIYDEDVQHQVDICDQRTQYTNLRRETLQELYPTATKAEIIDRLTTSDFVEFISQFWESDTIELCPELRIRQR